MDPTQRRLAERRLLAALRRFHREQPLAPDIRTDALLTRLRAEPAPRRSPRHRGGAQLTLDDSGLRAVLDELVAAGTVLREARRLRLPGHEPAMDPEMRARVDRLLAGLREAGAEPPRIDGVAARLGVPPVVVDQLRDAGELVSVAPGIDYPRDTYQELRARLDELAGRGPLTVARVRDVLRTSRRYAEALIARRRSERSSGRRAPRTKA